MSLPQGFRLAAAAADFRGKGKTRDDLALVVSDRPAAAAGVLTTNLFRAAPVLVAQEHLARAPEQIRGILINSGQANACTGEEGMAQCRESLTMVAEATGLNAETLLPASTGVIGALMDMEKWRAAVPDLAASLGHTDLERFARAIMTTDAFPKLAEAEIALDGGTVRLAGVAKGAGMICPNMGTMLCFITSDCAITSDMLTAALHEVVPRTFNRVTVDGDTSTNDACMVLCNGSAGNPLIDWKDDNYNIFKDALMYVCTYMARAIAADGEGASHLLTCTVSGSRSEEAAERLAKAVVGSMLVKAAMFGADANWGRVLCAMGYSRAPFRPDRVDASFYSSAGKIQVCKDGSAVEFDEDLAKKILSEHEVSIIINVNEGDYTATCWGCDLTYDYVRINGDYRT